MTVKRCTTRLIYRVTLLILALSLAACASPPSPPPQYATLQAVPSGASIHVIATQPDIEAPDAQSAGETVGSGAASGAGLGASAGLEAGLQGSIICGPFIIVCLPLFAISAAAIGAIGGSIVGSIGGAIVALPEEKAQALEVIMSTTLEEMDLAETLENQFARQSGERWTITEAEGNLEITLGLNTLYIEQFSGDNLSLEMSSSMVVRYGPGDSDATKTYLYRYSSERHHVDYWLQDEGGNFRAEVSAAFEDNVGLMIQTLERPP